VKVLLYRVTSVVHLPILVCCVRVWGGPGGGGGAGGKDAKEIIDLASKASVADQQKQVRKNVLGHVQFRHCYTVLQV
jgi:hypothetical protein